MFYTNLYANIINFEFKQIKSDIFLLKTETNSNRPTRGGVKQHKSLTNNKFPPPHISFEKANALETKDFQFLSVPQSDFSIHFDSRHGFPSVRIYETRPKIRMKLKNSGKKFVFEKKDIYLHCKFGTKARTSMSGRLLDKLNNVD